MIRSRLFSRFGSAASPVWGPTHYKVGSVPVAFPICGFESAGERITIRRLGISEQLGQPAPEEQLDDSRNVSLKSQSENGEKQTYELSSPCLQMVMRYLHRAPEYRAQADRSTS